MRFVSEGLFVRSNIFAKASNFSSPLKSLYSTQTRNLSSLTQLTWPEQKPSVDVNQFYGIFREQKYLSTEPLNLDPSQIQLHESLKSHAQSESAENEGLFVNFYHTFINCYYEKGASIFFDEMDKILSNRSEAEKKTLVNGMLYIMASSVNDDRESFGEFVKKYGQYIDFELSYVGAGDNLDPFLEFQNNLFKCLIYNELWNVLDLMLETAEKKYSVQYVLEVTSGNMLPHYGGNIGLHKDSGDKYDLSALIINGAPKPIMERYIGLIRDNLGQINLFEADNGDGLSIVEYAILFGRSDVLEMLMPEIQKQLQGSDKNQDKINRAYDVIDGKLQLTKDGIKGVLNHILLNNGCDRSFSLDPNHHEEKEIDATSRSMGFDFPLRAMMRIYCPSYLSTMDQGTDQQIREGLHSSIHAQPFNRIIAPYNQAGYMMHGEEIRKQTRLEFAKSGHEKCKDLLPRRERTPSLTVKPKNFDFRHLSDTEPSKGVL